MNFDPGMIAVVIVTIVIIGLLFMQKSASYATESPLSKLSKKLAKGSFLGKTPVEDCSTKYGTEWTKLTPTLCKKI